MPAKLVAAKADTSHEVAATLVMDSSNTAEQGNNWGTIKGQVVWGGAEMPKPEWLNVTIDKQHCLDVDLQKKLGQIVDLEKSTILNTSVQVDPKTKGLKNVFVYILIPVGVKLAVHPSLKDFKPTVELDQPGCLFFPRALALREGQVFVTKNSAPVQHNIRWIGDAEKNPGGSVVIMPGGQHEIKDLKAQRLPLSLECNIHGWMKGRLLVCDHPYFSITDDNGNFEIKDAPAGMHDVMIYHEEFGYRLGRKGRDGEPVAVKGGGVTDMGKLPMGGQ